MTKAPLPAGGQAWPAPPAPVDGTAAALTGRSTENPEGQGADRTALVEEIREDYALTNLDPIPRLEDLARRQLGLAPRSPAALILAGMVGTGTRLAVALTATVWFGRWAEIPWGRWAVILALLVLLDVSQHWWNMPMSSQSPWFKQTIADWTALVPTIIRESDLRELAGYTRRWARPLRPFVVGVAVAAAMLLACAVVTPDGLGGLPAGSAVLLAFLLYDFGATPIYWGVLFQWAFMARESRYEHRLFWASPADSPEVKKVMRKTARQGMAVGSWITGFLLFAVVLVSWGSPLVPPLAVGFVVIGYLAAIGAAVNGRAGIRRIIERCRNRRLTTLQRRIDAFEPDFARLSPDESRQVRDLLDLHHAIRDAPSAPSAARTITRTGVGLILPTVMFVVTVFGEVSAERLLDSILP